jgi:propionyl-CoA carboxylase alpha chain
MVVRLGAGSHEVAVTPAAGGVDVAVGDHALAVRSAWTPGEPLFSGTVDGKTLIAQVDREGIGWRLTHGGVSAHAVVLSRFGAQMMALMPAKAPPDTSCYLLSPMPGLLSQIAVKPGQEVKAGEPLAVVEAMKMENVLRAERDAKVKAIHAEPGASLAVDQKILEFE